MGGRAELWCHHPRGLGHPQGVGATTHWSLVQTLSWERRVLGGDLASQAGDGHLVRSRLGPHGRTSVF